MNLVDKMMAWESDEMSETEAIAFFQELVNTGIVWMLQGSYGRQAMRFLEAGLVFRP
jgi:hypothetical protein